MSDAVVKFGADLRGLRTGISQGESSIRQFAQRSEQTVSRMGSRMSSVLKGAFLVSAAEMVVRATVGGLNAADNLLDMSTRLNTSVESLQRVDLAAKLQGTDVESVATAIERITKGLADPENAKAGAAFEALGLDMERFIRLEVDSQVLALSEAFQESRKTGIGFVEIFDLIGKQAGNLIPLLSTPADELKKLLNDAPVVSEENIRRLAAANDNIDSYIDSIGKLAAEGAANGTVTDAQAQKYKEQGEAAAKAREQIKKAESEQLSNSRTKAGLDEAAEARNRQLEENRKRVQALREELEQLGIAEARRAGRNIKADKLEKEARIRKEAMRIHEETGLAPQLARKLAEKKDQLQEDADRAADGKRRKIRGPQPRVTLPPLDPTAINALNVNRNRLAAVGLGLDPFLKKPNAILDPAAEKAAAAGGQRPDRVMNKSEALLEKIEQHLAGLTAE